LNHASIIEGPDTSSMAPTSANGICHHLSARKPPATAASIVPIAPTAKPMAAKIPANLAISNGAGGVAGAPATAGVALSTLVAASPTPAAALSSMALSRDAAIFCI